MWPMMQIARRDRRLEHDRTPPPNRLRPIFRKLHQKQVSRLPLFAKESALDHIEADTAPPLRVAFQIREDAITTLTAN
jgi:hypothetical protein